MAGLRNSGGASAGEAIRSQVLLSLEAFKKKTQKTPPQAIELAKRRLRDWEMRGDELGKKGRRATPT